MTSGQIVTFRCEGGIGKVSTCPREYFGIVNLTRDLEGGHILSSPHVFSKDVKKTERLIFNRFSVPEKINGASYKKEKLIID